MDQNCTSLNLKSSESSNKPLKSAKIDNHRSIEIKIFFYGGRYSPQNLHIVADFDAAFEVLSKCFFRFVH